MNNTTVLQWKPNVADAQAGMQLAAWGTRKRLVKSLLLFLVFPCVAFGTLWDGPPAIGVIAGLAFSLIFPPILFAVLARQIVRQQRSHSAAMNLTVSGEGVERCWAGTTVRQTWDAVSEVLELPTCFVFVRDRTAVGSVEKSAIPDAGRLEEIRATIAAARPLHQRSSTFLALERGR